MNNYGAPWWLWGVVVVGMMIAIWVTARKKN